MAISVFDLFKIGIGPSSSHTVGPMKASLCFANSLAEENLLDACNSLKVELYGSLAATGAGHGSPGAIMLGLEGEKPESVEVSRIQARVQQIRDTGQLSLLGRKTLAFSYRDDLLMHRHKALPFHPNGMQFSAFDAKGNTLLRKTFFSVGGGFIIDESANADNILIEDAIALPYPFSSARELLQQCRDSGQCISSLMLNNEQAWRSEADINAQLDEIWRVMNASIEQGCQREGIMPGGLKVKRRAAHLYRQLKNRSGRSNEDPLMALDWVTLFALAVNEENAMGGRIVTAPTNGAAGIIPAVLRYYLDFSTATDSNDIRRFLLTAGAIGILYKINASISGAEVGCQGEVGSACSMAAGALAEVMGATPEQVENAAEIAMEHNLGLTCDPVGGLVQVPCIERNAMAAIKAISAARMAMRGNGEHYVSLDQVIKTMRDTGRDMQDKYKETARGGLALTVLEVPVSIIEC
ncbi:MAG: L-serine ammonia-lyase [Pseudomonadales bacterium]|nr:L-serine ammonia-lyase [Pseudomonadales bacterium]